MGHLRVSVFTTLSSMLVSITTENASMKWVLLAAVSSSSTPTGLNTRADAKGLNTRASTAATHTPKPSPNSRPRGPATSGSATSWRHSAMLPTEANHTASTTTRAGKDQPPLGVRAAQRRGRGCGGWGWDMAGRWAGKEGNCAP
jgi:hypothetical protein